MHATLFVGLKDVRLQKQMYFILYVIRCESQSVMMELIVIVFFSNFCKKKLQ